MNSNEIKIKRIIAYSSPSYYKNFVYIETEPEIQTGLYDILSDEELKKRADKYQIYTEEYAAVGDKKITRDEYDDGAAVIDGKAVDISGEAELRVRFLTPYNFVICAHLNPINETKYDTSMNDIMNNLLDNKIEFSDLTNFVEKLPRHRLDM
jgi:curved DNA-binding protein CbpA